MRRFLSLLLLLSLLITPVFAHPGRTDSAGGHYDRSTGEYHYHHGYSAHQHYDMDGDGIPDCPYNFKDTTNHSSGSSSNSAASSAAVQIQKSDSDSGKNVALNNFLLFIRFFFLTIGGAFVVYYCGFYLVCLILKIFQK